MTFAFVLVLLLVLATPFAIDAHRKRRFLRGTTAHVLYDNPQRVSFWPTSDDDKTSAPEMMQLRITTNEISIVPSSEPGSTQWKFTPASATAAASAEGVMLVTDDVSFLFHPDYAFDDLCDLLMQAGAAGATL